MIRRGVVRLQGSHRPPLFSPEGNPNLGRGGGQAQRPGTFAWVVRDKMTPREIWDFLQKTYLNHRVLGFAARCGLFGALVAGCALFAYRVSVLAMETRPIAEQWVPRHRQITFLERIQEGESNMHIYRFALPNSYDYLGHKSIMSVELLIDNHWLFPTRRWYTPISHPEQRGIVEFAVKHHLPGEMTEHLRTLEPGDRVFMGPWIKEWRYKPNRYKEIGLVCGNSGITPALQLLVSALDDPADETKFSLLFLNRAPEAIPFKSKLEAIQKKYPDRFRATFAVTGGVKDGRNVVAQRATDMLAEYGWPEESFSASSLRKSVMAYSMGEGGRLKPVELVKSYDAGYDGYLGMVNRDLLLESMPPPTRDNMILCCGPQAMMTNVCGRSVGWFRTTYFEGFFGGMLKDMGYRSSQVYRFGTSWHFYMSSVA